jgi:hypothetical protein
MPIPRPTATTLNNKLTTNAAKNSHELLAIRSPASEPINRMSGKLAINGKNL